MSLCNLQKHVIAGVDQPMLMKSGSGIFRFPFFWFEIMDFGKKSKPPKIIKKKTDFLRKNYVIFAQVERNWK